MHLISELLQAAFSILGTLVGVWYGAKLTRDTTRATQLEQARQQFISSFAETLARLGEGVTEPGVGEAIHILNKDFPQHYRAYIRLRTAMPKDRRSLVDSAWNRYTMENEYAEREEGRAYRFVNILEPKDDDHQFMLAQKHILNLLDNTQFND